MGYIKDLLVGNFDKATKNHRQLDRGGAYPTWEWPGLLSKKKIIGPIPLPPPIHQITQLHSLQLYSLRGSDSLHIIMSKFARIM